MSKEDLKARGWEELDIILVSGDAYVDHPSFGAALLGRLLESKGFKVGILSQPDWHDAKSFMKLGKPRLFFGVTSGNIDSMVNHYTANKKRRKQDAYSPGGQGDLRPDRALVVYSQRLREAYKGTPIIIGGIEASLRRFAHYDYWSDKVRRSILFDSKADLLVYGMGERQITEIAERLDRWEQIEKINNIAGTCFISKEIEFATAKVEVPSFEEVISDKGKYSEAFKIQLEEQDPFTGKTICQKHGDRYLVQNPPAKPLATPEMDEVYDLSYVRTYHPSYQQFGGVPALQEVEFSITSHRGCYGGCSFCALTFHQGRIIQSRSHESIIREAEVLTELPNFKGIIHDVGGPTANFRTKACEKQETKGVCSHRQCLHPEPCKQLQVEHEDYLSLLKKIRALPGVKKVFVRSGIRYDYLVADKSDKFFKELCEHHVSGQLKVAPEHVSAKVLDVMGKPKRDIYNSFVDKYQTINKKLGKNQYLVPYFMSSHPGSSLKEAIELAEYIRDMGYNPEQVQDFTPTPGSLSTSIYYTGHHPLTGKKVYVPKGQKEKDMQRALMQYRNPKNYELVREALLKAGRRDLIGYGEKALVRPEKFQNKKEEPKPDYRKINKKLKKIKSNQKKAAKR